MYILAIFTNSGGYLGGVMVPEEHTVRTKNYSDNARFPLLQTQIEAKDFYVSLWNDEANWTLERV